MRGGNVNHYTISDLRCSSCSSYTTNVHPLTRIDFIGPRTVFIASHLVIIRITHIIVFYDRGFPPYIFSPVGDTTFNMYL